MSSHGVTLNFLVEWNSALTCRNSPRTIPRLRTPIYMQSTIKDVCDQAWHTRFNHCTLTGRIFLVFHIIRSFLIFIFVFIFLLSLPSFRPNFRTLTATALLFTKFAWVVARKKSHLFLAFIRPLTASPVTVCDLTSDSWRVKQLLSGKLNG